MFVLFASRLYFDVTLQLSQLQLQTFYNISISLSKGELTGAVLGLLSDSCGEKQTFWLILEIFFRKKTWYNYVGMKKYTTSLISTPKI